MIWQLSNRNLKKRGLIVPRPPSWDPPGTSLEGHMADFGPSSTEERVSSYEIDRFLDGQIFPDFGWLLGLLLGFSPGTPPWTSSVSGRAAAKFQFKMPRGERGILNWNFAAARRLMNFAPLVLFKLLRSSQIINL